MTYLECSMFFFKKGSAMAVCFFVTSSYLSTIDMCENNSDRRVSEGERQAISHSEM